MFAYSPLCGHEYRMHILLFFLNYLQLIVIGLLFEPKIKEALDSVWYRKTLYAYALDITSFKTVVHFRFIRETVV